MSSAVPQSTRLDRETLIEQNLGYVRAMALDILRTLPAHVELDELVACGNVGLVEAAERFDPRHRTSFRTFAYYRIRGAIYDALRKMGPLSRADYSRARIAANATNLLQTLADDEHAYPESGASASMDDEIRAAQAALDALIPAYLLSLEAESVLELADDAPNALDQIERKELITLMRSMVDQLPEDDREVIQLVYYGGLGVSELGARLGVSKSWASRLHAKSVKRLREVMHRNGLLTAI